MANSEEDDFGDDFEYGAMQDDYGAAPAAQPPLADASGGAMATAAAAAAALDTRGWLEKHKMHRQDMTRNKDRDVWVVEVAQVLEGANLHTQTQVRPAGLFVSSRTRPRPTQC